jgi:diguanylate cyclase (GGDEF)-like protein
MIATARTEGEKRAQMRAQGRVLLISDDASMVAHFATFQSAGLGISGVAGGAGALVALQRTRPHVVIADTRLSGVSAGEFCRKLREMEEAIPYALVGSEKSSAERRAEAMAEGAADYFQLPDELSLLVARTHQLVAYKQLIERLRAEADIDYLTGLANRRRFRKALEQEVERWRRYKVPCALLLADIDHLKKINDAHGHATGDEVIRAVAKALTGHSRDNDTAARLGGEEFALLLAGADAEKAFAVAERLRLSVASAPVGEAGFVSISLGVGGCPAHGASDRALYAASDAALYRAKYDGRNRSSMADASGPGNS